MIHTLATKVLDSNSFFQCRDVQGTWAQKRKWKNELQWNSVRLAICLFCIRANCMYFAFICSL